MNARPRFVLAAALARWRRASSFVILSLGTDRALHATALSQGWASRQATRSSSLRRPIGRSTAWPSVTSRRLSHPIGPCSTL